MKYQKLVCLLIAALCFVLTACDVFVDPDGGPPPEPVKTEPVVPDSVGEITWGGQTFSPDTESLVLNLQVRSNEILDLSPLSYCTQLRYLSLHVTVVPHIYRDRLGDRRVMDFTPVDLSPLASLDNLERLDLNVQKIADLMPLASLPNLKMLALWFENDIDLTPLISCENLVNLSLGGRAVIDLSPLSRCALLTKLRVDVYDSEWNFPDLSKLSGAPSLQMLSVGSSYGLRNLTDVPLSYLVDLNDSSDILENLPMLDTLTTVECSDEHLSDIAPLLIGSSVTEIVLEVGMQEIENGTELTDPNDAVLDRLITSIPIAQLREFLSGGGSITLVVSSRVAG